MKNSSPAKYIIKYIYNEDNLYPYIVNLGNIIPYLRAIAISFFHTYPRYFTNKEFNMLKEISENPKQSCMYLNSQYYLIKILSRHIINNMQDTIELVKVNNGNELIDNN